MTKAAEEGSKETYRSPSARAGRTRQKFFHLHRNAVAKLMQRGLSGREIATALSIPVGSVFAVMRAAKQTAWRTRGSQRAKLEA